MISSLCLPEYRLPASNSRPRDPQTRSPIHAVIKKSTETEEERMFTRRHGCAVLAFHPSIYGKDGGVSVPIVDFCMGVEPMSSQTSRKNPQNGQFDRFLEAVGPIENESLFDEFDLTFRRLAASGRDAAPSLNTRRYSKAPSPSPSLSAISIRSLNRA